MNINDTSTNQNITTKNSCYINFINKLVTKEETKNAIKKDLNTFVDKLHELYKDAYMPRVEFLTDGTEHRINENYMEQQLEELGQVICLKDLFKENTKIRILIEALPGYGKTTLCTKIAHDWASKKDYLKRFQFVFGVKLRKLEKKDLKKALASIYENCCLENDYFDELMKMIMHEPPKTLLLFDGFDELGKEDRKNFLRVLYIPAYHSFNIILTCRSGLFDVDVKELEELNDINLGKIGKNFYDKRLTLVGVKKEEISEFINKRSSKENAARIIQFLNGFDKSLDGIFRSPLFLNFLEHLLDKDETVFEHSNTKLLLNLINCMIRHCLAIINDPELINMIDIFDFKDKNSFIYRERLIEVGNLVLEKIKKKEKCQLPYNKSMSDIHKIGLLIKCKKKKSDETIYFYEPFHSLVQDVSVSYTIWRNFENNGSNFKDDHSSFLCKIFENSKDCSKILPILIYFLGERVENLFQLLLPGERVNSRIYSHYLKLIENSTFALSDFNAVKRFLPPRIGFTLTNKNPQDTKLDFENDSIENLSIFRVEIYRTHEIKLKLNLKQWEKLPFDIKIPHLVVTENQLKDTEQILNNRFTRKVRCRSFTFQLLSPIALGLISKITADKWALVFDENCSFDDFCKYDFKNLKLDFLSVHFEISKQNCERLGHKLKLLQVQRLELKIRKSEDFKLLWSAVQEIECLDELIIIRSCPKMLEITSFPFDGKKKWKFISLQNFNLSLQEPKESVAEKNVCRLQISHLKNVKIEVDWLRHFSLKVLECQDWILHEICQKIPEWRGFVSIEQMSVEFCSNKVNLSENLKSFSNLATLEISVMDKQANVDDAVVASLDIVFLKNLTITCDIGKRKIENSYLPNLFKKFDKIIDERKHKDQPLSMLNIELSTTFTKESTLNLIKSFIRYLRNGICQQLGLVYNDFNSWNILKRRETVNLSFFRMIDYLGKRIDDPFRHQLESNPFATPKIRINVTLEDLNRNLNLENDLIDLVYENQTPICVKKENSLTMYKPRNVSLSTTVESEKIFEMETKNENPDLKSENPVTSEKNGDDFIELEKLGKNSPSLTENRKLSLLSSEENDEISNSEQICEDLLSLEKGGDKPLASSRNDENLSLSEIDDEFSFLSDKDDENSILSEKINENLLPTQRNVEDSFPLIEQGEISLASRTDSENSISLENICKETAVNSPRKHENMSTTTMNNDENVSRSNLSEQPLENAGHDDNQLTSNSENGIPSPPISRNDNFHPLPNSSMQHNSNNSINNKAIGKERAQKEKQLSNIAKKLDDGLRKLYKDSMMPRIEFMTEEIGYDINKNYMNQHLKEEKNAVQLKDLFKRNENLFTVNSSKRIFVEAHPGYGKTTLCIKIAQDWASKKDYLKHFQFVFLLKLKERDMSGENIEAMIISFAEKCGVMEKKPLILKLVKKNIPKILFLLDGFDELPKEDRENCLRILYLPAYRGLNILLTCRTGLFNVGWKELEKLTGVSLGKRFYDRKITLFGLQNKEIRGFIKKRYSKEKQEQIITFLDSLDSLDKSLHYLLHSPLLLNYLGEIFDKEKTIMEQQIHFNSKLFLNLINYMIRHCLLSNNMEISKTFNIFDVKDENSSIYQKQLIKFGDSELEKVRNNDSFVLSDNELINNIHRMGLLINHEKSDEEGCNAFHLKLKEMAMAYTIWQKFLSDDFKCKSNHLDFIIKNFESSDSFYPVFIFLVSLLGKHATKLLQLLHPEEYIDKICDRHFLKLIEKSQFCTNSLQAVKRFYPPIISLNLTNKTDNNIKLKSPNVSIGNISNFIVAISLTYEVTINSDQWEELPIDIKIPHLIINERLVKDNDQSLNNSSNLKKVKCHSVTFQLSSAKMLSLLPKIEAENRALKTDENDFFHDINNDYLKNMKFDMLSIPFEINEQRLGDVLNKFHVRRLELRIHKADDFSRLRTNIHNILSLDELVIIGNGIKKMEMTSFPFEQNKLWKFISLENINVCIKKSDEKKICRLQIFKKVKIEVDWLQHFGLKVLECQDCILHQIFKKNVWTGLTSIEQLSIECRSNKLKFSEKLNKFSKLQTLEFLVVNNKTKLDEAISSLNLDSLKNLTITCDIKTVTSSYLSIETIRKIKDKENSRNQSLSMLNFELSKTFSTDSLSLYIKEFLSCLENGLLQQIGIIYDDEKWWNFLKKQETIDLSYFLMTEDFLGDREDDPSRHQLELNPFATPKNRINLAQKDIFIHF